MSPQRSSLDARFAQAEASQNLQELLHLARVHRDVADWLYSDCPEVQRTDGILSPEQFATGDAMGTMQSSTDLGVPLTAGGKSNEYTELWSYSLFVPVKECNGISVGYSFLTGISKHGSSFLADDLYPAINTSRGRYAYKKDARMLLMLQKSTANTDFALLMQWTGETMRRIHYCVIPHRQYSFDDQPKVVMASVTGSADFLCSSIPSEQENRSLSTTVDVSNDDMLPSGPADFVDGDWREDNINSLPQCMFHDLEDGTGRENGYYQESSAWLNEHQRRSLSGRHNRGLIQFETRRRRREGCDMPTSIMWGNFFSAHVVRCTFDEGGRLAERHAFEVRTVSRRPDRDCIEMLRRVASQVYYSAVLWASTDQCLVAAQEQVAAELMWGKDEDGEGSNECT